MNIKKHSSSFRKWLKNLQSGEIKLDKVSDLKILIEADLMLKDIDND
ncbi:hypothetical protein IGJ51_001513 [Enterococcus sp. DIV0802c]